MTERGWDHVWNMYEAAEDISARCISMMLDEVLEFVVSRGHTAEIMACARCGWPVVVITDIVQQGPDDDGAANRVLEVEAEIHARFPHVGEIIEDICPAGSSRELRELANDEEA